MEKLVQATISKFSVLSILECYYRLFKLIYIRFNDAGITIQGSCDERGICVTTTIPKDSLDNYMCKDTYIVLIPNCIKKLGGMLTEINVMKVDSWRVKNAFKSSNGVSYEVLSSYMYKLEPIVIPANDRAFEFEHYPLVKKCLIEGITKSIEVGFNDDRIASFRVNNGISMFVIGDINEMHYTIPIECLKFLNKFTGSSIKNSSIEFYRAEDRLNETNLFLINKKFYHTHI